MDLEKILLEFAISFSENPSKEIGKDPKADAMNLFGRVREFAAKYKQKPGLLEQYREAIDSEQYEIAYILKKQIMKIINQEKGEKNGCA